MKIFIVGNEQPDKFGGGPSFIKNLTRITEDPNFEITMNPEECDIYFITSVSLLDKMSQIPKGKKVVLRIDNVLKDSNNRRMYGEWTDKITRMEAMRLINQKYADAVVYQSQWAYDYLKPFLGASKGFERVILNGSDDSLYNPTGGKIPSDYRPVYLYVRSSNHDNKGFHVAWWEYQKIQRREPNAVLWIVGRFSPENNEHNFDFFQGENYKYWGFVADPEQMALIYRSADCLLFPFFMDACSNTLIEAILSGLKIRVLIGGNTGGTPEIIEKFKQQGRDYFRLERMLNDYKLCFKELNG